MGNKIFLEDKMKQYVFEVQTRLMGERYVYGSMWSGYNVIAKDAEDAIRVARKKMDIDRKEHAMTVKLLAELD